MCRGRDNGGIINPLAARCLAVAEAQTSVGAHVQRGETGQVGVECESRDDLMSVNSFFHNERILSQCL